MTLPAALALLIDLEGQGFTLRAEAGRVIVTPGKRLTADQAGAVRRLKPLLLALLTEPVAGEDVSGWDDPALYCPHAMSRAIAVIEAHNAAAARAWKKRTEAKANRKGR